ncbi:MAG: hypothetical protein NUV70_02365 [Caldiserica bacterium]|jgi:hypothetical protein|nr:hypothetical protein [Caldisericota bacterium]
MRKKEKNLDLSTVQARLEELFPGFSWDKEGWDGLISKMEGLVKEIKHLKDQLMISRSELHQQAGLNSTLTYRLYELEQAVGILEKQVSGEKAMAQGALLRVKYLERLFQEYAQRLPEEDRKAIEEALRREVYFCPNDGKD